ncbi:hypothetical protein Tco_0858849 [Tanacetum coccineum]|uniref:Uncharacterized protein n=1 Tax=Tanacetum coccineum TaxID=301880 RepID=A0ABQ5BCH2_9ASTR
MEDFQENYNDEVDERTSEEYIRDLDIGFHKRALLAGSKQPSYKSSVSNSSLVSSGFQPKFTPKLIQSSQQVQSSQNKPKIQKDYKTKYKKVKAKLALLDVSLSTTQSLKPFQSKREGSDDEFAVGKNHARNGEWIDIAMRKLTKASSKNDVKENPFIPAVKVWLLTAASSFFESRYFLSPSSYFPAMSKNDMKDRICALSKNDLKDLVKTYRIPLDLHPRLLDPEFTMDHLPADAIGIYSEFL